MLLQALTVVWLLLQVAVAVRGTDGTWPLTSFAMFSEAPERHYEWVLQGTTGAGRAVDVAASDFGVTDAQLANYLRDAVGGEVGQPHADAPEGLARLATIYEQRQGIDLDRLTAFQAVFDPPLHVEPRAGTRGDVHRGPGMSATAAWRRFWLPAVPLERLALFRVVVAGFTLLYALTEMRTMLGYGDVDPLFYDPIVGLRLLPMPGPTPLAFAVAYGLLLVLLGLATAGAWTRASLTSSVVVMWWWYATYYSFGKIDHAVGPLVFSLAVLAIAPSGARLSVDARRRRGRPDDPQAEQVAGWALRMVMVFVVGVYVLSAFAKLTDTGPSWAFGPVLGFHIASAGGTLQQLLLALPWTIVAMQTASLVFESTAFMALAGPRWRNALPRRRCGVPSRHVRAARHQLPAAGGLLRRVLPAGAGARRPPAQRDTDAPAGTDRTGRRRLRDPWGRQDSNLWPTACKAAALTI